MKCLNKLFGFFLVVLLSACGGGGGSSGANPNQSNLISTSGDSVILSAGSFREYRVSGGVPPYQVATSEPAIAVGSISGSTLTIGALSGGKAGIRIYDYKGTSISTEVTVGSSVALYTTAPDSISVGIGVVRKFFIGGGSPPYRVEGGSASTATVAMVDATNWSITGVAANSSGTVKIIDSAGASKDIIFNTNPPPLTISASDMKVPTGYEVEVTVSGGQAPYYPASGLPALIHVTPSVNTDGKFKIVGDVETGEFAVSFRDSAGQTVSVKITFFTGGLGFKVSPASFALSETSTESLTFQLYGFTGDTGGAGGEVCIYVSDPSYFTLDSTRKTCSTFTSTSRTFTLVTGTRGNRCVSGDTSITLRIVDSMGNTAIAGVDETTKLPIMPRVVVLDNGTSCEAGVVNTGGLSVTPGGAVALSASVTNQTVFIMGGSGSYVATSGNSNVATVSMSGNQLTVTRGGTLGGTTITVVDTANPTKTTALTVNNS